MIWSFMLLILTCISFTMINLNVITARQMYSTVKADLQASDGSWLNDSPDADGYNYHRYAGWTNGNLKGSADTMKNFLDHHGYSWQYAIKRLTNVDDDVQDSNETYIYHDLYKLDMTYSYTVPLFGRQVYPLSGYVY